MLATWEYGTSHPFWLANRGKPIADNSGVLAIDGSGNMKLTCSGGDLVDFNSSRSSASNRSYGKALTFLLTHSCLE